MRQLLTRRELLAKASKSAVAFAAGSMAMVLAEPVCAKTVSSDNSVRYLEVAFERPYLEARKAPYEEFCRKYGFDKDDTEVRFEYAAVGLFHEMIRKEGILRNQYVPIDNRVGRIKKLVGGKAEPLGNEARRRGSAKMLKDMFSVRPRYQLPSGQRAYCFGDCDEFEMTYVTMLDYVGIKSRVVMVEPFHVNTLVSIRGKELLVDNTRNSFLTERACEAECQDYMTGKDGYKKKSEAKEYIESINRRAHGKTVVQLPQKGTDRAERWIKKEFNEY